jgi:hypothetical protein
LYRATNHCREAVVEQRLQAASALDALLANRVLGGEGLAAVRVGAYAFNHVGELIELFPLTKLTLASISTMRSALIAMPQGPINPASSISAAMVKLADPTEGRLIGAAGTTVGDLATVVLFSDGDPLKLVEDDTLFANNMAEFRRLRYGGRLRV